MMVVLAACTMLFLWLYLRKSATLTLAEGLLLGVIWLGMSLLFDLPMFSAGPTKKRLGEYLAEIGAAYLIFPVLTVGAASLLRTRDR